MASEHSSISRANNSHSSLHLDESQSSRTISDLPVTSDLTLLRRREVEVGMVLGRGRYSEVSTIERLHFKKADAKKSLRPDGRYVMKHIQNKLFAHRGHRRVARDLTNAIADLVTEAMYLSKIRHPNIIRLRGLTKGGTSVLKRPGANAEDYFLVLDRMEETLEHRIHQKWKLKPQTTALVLDKTRYAWQMASALSYLHEHQIIYRDAKPSNMGFLRNPPDSPHPDRLQLFDFGLARELDEPPPAQGKKQRLYSLSASGTRRYMAPEIFNKEGKYNYSCDVYSWAIVYYECLSHVKPFADFTTQSHEELVCRLGGRPKLREIEWPDADGVSEEVEALLATAWHQDLLQRPSMARICEQLEDLLKRQGVVSEPSALAGYNNMNEENAIQVQQHFFANDPSAVIFLQKKTSTSELTVATDPIASDSEVDEDQANARWSLTSGRSSISSLNSIPRTN